MQKGDTPYIIEVPDNPRSYGGGFKLYQAAPEAEILIEYNDLCFADGGVVYLMQLPKRASLLKNGKVMESAALSIRKRRKKNA